MTTNEVKSAATAGSAEQEVGHRPTEPQAVQSAHAIIETQGRRLEIHVPDHDGFLEFVIQAARLWLDDLKNTACAVGTTEHTVAG